MHKLTTIAKNMNRSYESVRIKMNRLGISNTKAQTGLLTIGELATCLNIDRTIIKGWIERHGLLCVKKVTRKSKCFYFIETAYFWDWAEQHKDKVQFSKIESYTLLPEPDWVAVEREKEIQNQIVKKRPYKTWTLKDEKQIICLRNRGLTYAEIGEAMNRSAISIARRIKRISN